MAIAPPRLASAPQQALNSLFTFCDLMHSPDAGLRGELVIRLSYVHSWIFVRDEQTGEPLFGPSKFVGYRDMTVETYVEHLNLMDGRDTERALEPWVRVITEADADYEELHQKLHEFCAQFGKKPRTPCRISMLTMETDRGANVAEREAALVDLVVRVCETLPLERRREVVRRISRH